MNTSLKIKFVLFLGFLGGILFFAKNIILPPYYQTSLTIALVPKEVNSRNIESAKESSAYAAALLKEALFGNVFLKKLKAESDLQFKRFESQGISLQDISPMEWRGTLSVFRNPEPETLTIEISHTDPNLASLLALSTAKTISRNFTSFTNNQELDLKILDRPEEAMLPDTFYLLLSFLKGFLLSSLLALILTLIFKEKALNWMFVKKPSKIQKRSILPKEILSRPIEIPPKTKKKTSRKTARKAPKNAPYLDNNEEIKERLNRLISGEL